MKKDEQGLDPLVKSESGMKSENLKSELKNDEIETLDTPDCFIRKIDYS